MFQLITCIEHDGELIRNTVEITNSLAAQYATVGTTESHSLDFLTRKVEIQQDLDFETEEYETYNVPFKMRELQSAIRSGTPAGPDDTLQAYVNCRL